MGIREPAPPRLVVAQRKLVDADRTKQSKRIAKPKTIQATTVRKPIPK